MEGGGVTIRNRKNIWHARDSNPGPTASEPCCPNPTAIIYFWIKRVSNFGLKKKRPYWMNFSLILHMRRKIKSKLLYSVHTSRAMLRIDVQRCWGSTSNNFLSKTVGLVLVVFRFSQTQKMISLKITAVHKQAFWSAPSKALEGPYPTSGLWTTTSARFFEFKTTSTKTSPGVYGKGLLWYFTDSPYYEISNDHWMAVIKSVSLGRQANFFELQKSI